MGHAHRQSVTLGLAKKHLEQALELLGTGYNREENRSDVLPLNLEKFTK